MVAELYLPPLQAGSGSFSLGTSSINLTYRRLSVSSSSYETKVYGVPRLQAGEVQFVSAAVDDSASVVMPTHQANDLLLVLAVNTSGSTFTPNTVSGWTTLGQAGGGSLPYRLAYKWATSSTEIAGIWAGSTRTTAIVYRNVRNISAPSSVLFGGNTLIRYPSPTQTSNAGSRGVLIGATVSNNGAEILPGTDATTPITGVTTRLTSSSAGIAIPAIGVHDFVLDPGQLAWSISDTDVTVPSLTVARTWGIILEQGVHDLTAETASFDTTLNGDVFANTLQVVSRRYALELTPAITTYLTFYDADPVSYTTSGGSINTPFGYGLFAETASFALNLLDVDLKRDLKVVIQTETFTFAGGAVDLPKGFFTTPQTGIFPASFSNVGQFHAAFLDAQKQDFLVDTKFELIRSIIESFGTTNFPDHYGQIGIRNDVSTPFPGGLFKPATSKYGGSNKTNPQGLRPETVKFNSVSKSRDLGVVNNFLGEFNGEIGSQSGTQTLFFKIRTLGDADLRILKKTANRFTDKQIGVGVLNAERQPIPVNDFGFAYQNEIESTEISEFENALPAGTYYFTVSSSLWQTVPFSITIQAIRFVGLEGSARLTAALSARFAIAKLNGPALLTAPFVSTIPTQTNLKRPTGTALLTSATQGTFTTPAGIAVGRMLPTGRLKLTHKIRGAALGTGANVATLVAFPPYGYGGP